MRQQGAAEKRKKNPYSAGKGFGDSLYPRGTSENNDQKKSGEKEN